MGLFSSLLPIIAGLGITAATGGFGAPLGAAVAGGGAAGAGAAGAAGLGAAEAGLGAGLAAAAPAAAETGLASAAASAAPSIAAPASLTPTALPTVASMGPMPSIPQPGFIDKAAGWLGDNPMVPLMGAAALMPPTPRPVPQMQLNAAPVHTAPQAQPQQMGGLPGRNFQQNLISSLARR